MGIALSEKHVASKVTYNGFAQKQVRNRHYQQSQRSYCHGWSTGHGVVFPLQGAFTPCFCVKMRRSQPQTLGPMPKSWRLLQRAFSHFLPNWALTFLNKIPASVASGSQGLIKNTQEIYIPDFFDEEFDQRYDVPGLWKCGLSQLSRRLYIADINIMCMVHHVCIHHIGMPDILAQYTRALEVSFHHWKPSLCQKQCSTLHHWLQRISFWPEFLAKH